MNSNKKAVTDQHLLGDGKRFAWRGRWVALLVLWAEIASKTELACFWSLVHPRSIFYVWGGLATSAPGPTQVSSAAPPSANPLHSMLQHPSASCAGTGMLTAELAGFASWCCFVLEKGLCAQVHWRKGLHPLSTSTGQLTIIQGSERLFIRRMVCYEGDWVQNSKIHLQFLAKTVKLNSLLSVTLKKVKFKNLQQMFEFW